jgi:DNA-binding LytR/AlgR family response regulator
MNKITCIAIDDEPLALGLVVGYIEKTPFLELLGQFDNPLDAMEFVETNPVQLLFLDIQMPDLIGTDFARILDKKSKVIFTTAYDNYAVEGFKIEALDYLLKPISYEIFLKSAQRAKNYFELFNSKSNDTDSSIRSDEEYLFIKADYKIRRIHTAIFFILKG